MRPETGSWLGYHYLDRSGGSWLAEADGYGDLGGDRLLEREDGSSASTLSLFGRWAGSDHGGDGFGWSEIDLVHRRMGYR